MFNPTPARPLRVALAALAATVASAFGTPTAHGQASCGAPNTNNCCVANLTAGCADASCCQLICSIDPFCCATRWDAVCADLTVGACDGCVGDPTSCGDPSTGDCCIPQAGPHCSDQACCEFICLADIACCEAAWDDICAEQALKLCESCQPIGGGCGAPNTNDCCEVNESGGCADEKCCGIVCALDAFCCNTQWDLACVKLSEALCAICSPLLGDLNGDGAVNSADLAILLSAWNGPGGDLNGDGVTNSPDLSILLGNWS